MRGAMIAAGAALIARFHWILYVFGVLLIVTAVKMLFVGGHGGDPSRNVLVRAARRFLPVTERFHGEHFFVRAGSAAAHAPPTPGAPVELDAAVARFEAARRGALMVTPLLLALLVVEATDLIFAVDSIPAIFAVTGDPFLVFTSNVFAILGLRSLYFALAGMIDRFRYLKVALAGVLAIVGTKMLLASWLKQLAGPHFNFYLLAAVILTLAAGVIASLVADRRTRRTSGQPVASGKGNATATFARDG
jgi:tellurite resistance protein TerC